jgi:hypothetical protein
MVRPRLRRLVLPLAALAVTAGVATAYLAWPTAALPIEPSCRVTGPSGTYSLDLEQAANAATIAVTAKRMGLADHAVTVGLEAALQESGLHNLDHGDRDSLGLFQQRPSQGWGTSPQIMDSRYASTMFFRHLAKVRGWETLPVDAAAQRVQHSAAPHAYARWEAVARALATAVTGEVPAGLGCQFPDPATASSRTAVERAISAQWGEVPLGRPLEAARGWMVASWLVGHAEPLGIRSVTYAGRRWTSSSHAWEQGPTSEARVRIALAT